MGVTVGVEAAVGYSEFQQALTVAAHGFSGEAQVVPAHHPGVCVAVLPQHPAQDTLGCIR